MDKRQTLHIIHTLAQGIDPITGEVFPSDSPYQNVDVVRALFHAAQIIDATKDVPSNSGSPWSEDEQEKVVQAYTSGTPISQIAKNHQRTSGAIRSRLQKLGLLE